MKYFKGIMEGEGIVGFRPISVTTTPLLSCLAIGMAHSKSYQFGLYHYPALTLGTPGVDQVITAMINAIKPDTLSITAGFLDAQENDIQGVIKFIAQLGYKKIWRDPKVTNGVEFIWEENVMLPRYCPNTNHAEDEKPVGFTRLKCTNQTFITSAEGNTQYFRSHV